MGRFWIEGLRVDAAHHIFGLRLNQWTSIILFIGAMAYFWYTRNKTDEEPVRSATDPDADLEGGVATPGEDESTDGIDGTDSAKAEAVTLVASDAGGGAADPVDPAIPPTRPTRPRTTVRPGGTTRRGRPRRRWWPRA